jgi:hypothetical protein
LCAPSGLIAPTTITTITRKDQIITTPRIVTKDGKSRASPPSQEGSDHHHTKDCDKDGKPRASPPSQGRIRSLPYQGL